MHMNFLFGRYLANWLTLNHCIQKRTYEDYSLRQMWVYVHGSSTSPGRMASSPTSSPADMLLPLTPSWSQASDLNTCIPLSERNLKMDEASAHPRNKTQQAVQWAWALPTLKPALCLHPIGHPRHNHEHCAEAPGHKDEQ